MKARPRRMAMGPLRGRMEITQARRAGLATKGRPPDQTGITREWCAVARLVKRRPQYLDALVEIISAEKAFGVT